MENKDKNCAVALKGSARGIKNRGLDLKFNISDLKVLGSQA